MLVAPEIEIFNDTKEIIESRDTLAILILNIASNNIFSASRILKKFYWKCEKCMMQLQIENEIKSSKILLIAISTIKTYF